MKILLVSSMFPPYCGGGVSSHVSDLAASLSKVGDDVCVLTSRRGQPARIDEQTFTPPGTEVVYCTRFSSMLARIGDMIRRDSYDLVHYHSFNALALAFLNRGKDTATVFTIHGVSSDLLASQHGWSKDHPAYLGLRTYERISATLPDVTIAVSHYLYGYAGSITTGRVIYVPNSVDCEFWNPESGDEVSHSGHFVLVPCSLVPTKGVEHAIRSMAIVLKELPRTRMVIAGDGPLRDKLEQLAVSIADAYGKTIHTSHPSRVTTSDDCTSRDSRRKDSFSDAFLFLGDIPRYRMRELYNGADVVLIPSVRLSGAQEGLSIAALEAMACRKPVIASNLGGLKELITNGKEGILVPEGSPVELARAIIQVLGNRKLACQLGDAARRRVLSDYSIPVWTKRMRDAYRLAQTENH